MHFLKNKNSFWLVLCYLHQKLTWLVDSGRRETPRNGWETSGVGGEKRVDHESGHNQTRGNHEIVKEERERKREDMFKIVVIVAIVVRE
jgi:hypothetical protein